MTTSLLALVGKQGAFYRKTWLLETAYGAGFVVRLLGGLLPLVFFYFLARIVDAQDPRLVAYRGDYFAFVAIGVALSQYFGRASSGCVRELRQAQIAGVLEASLSTRTSPVAVVAHETISHFTFSSLHLLVVLGAAVGVLGVDLSRANWPVALLGFSCAVVAFAGMTALSAAMVVHFKSAEPAHVLLGGLGSFLAGAYFPVAVLPGPLRGLAELLPMMHALEVLRLSLLSGAPLASVATSLAKLGGLAVIWTAVGTTAFTWAVRRARRDGTLGLF